MQQKGWLLGRNANVTYLEKGNITLVFDIKIHTKRGTLFAMRHVRESQWIDRIGNMRIAATGTDENKQIEENKQTQTRRGSREA